VTGRESSGARVPRASSTAPFHLWSDRQIARERQRASYRRFEEIQGAYWYCVDHDHWPDSFDPFNAIRDLIEEVRRYRRSLSAHHELGTLSDAAIREGIGHGCQVCARAQR
jgi:hypothetical protein